MNDSVMQSGFTRTGTAPAQAAAPSSKPVVTAAPRHEEIARRAYEIYVQKGRKAGQCQQNWKQAEQDLRQQGKAACAAKGCCGNQLPAAEAGSSASVKTVAEAGAKPALKTVSGALRSIMGGNGSARRGATPATARGRGGKA